MRILLLRRTRADLRTYRRRICMRALQVIAIGAAIAVSVQAQVVNGGFETGDFTGWTQWGDTSFTGVDSSSVYGVGPHSGVSEAYFGPTGGFGGIQQNLIAPANSTITVSFWMAQAFGSIGTQMYATLDGQTLVSLTDFADTDYRQFTATVTTTNANPLLQFAFYDPPDWFILDDVTAVPEPASLGLLGLGLLLTLRRR